MAVAPSLSDVVQFAGGWLFDRVMAGWDVTVLTADHSDSRPLRILGASVAELESELPALALGPWPQAIAVDVNMYESDARVRRMTADAIANGVSEVRLWGDRWPSDLDLDAGIDSVHHRLSTAARVFKAKALAAAAADVESPRVTEIFRSSSYPVPAGAA